MPNYKNHFKAPDYIEEEIVDENDGKIGTIRIKPSSVLWKPKGQHAFYVVSLDRFSEWITAGATKAKRVKS